MMPAIVAHLPPSWYTLYELTKLDDEQWRMALGAEPLYRRSLAILEKALGAENPDVATSLNNLALLYQAQGNYTEAEPLHKRVLAIDEKALGSPGQRVEPGRAVTLHSMP